MKKTTIFTLLMFFAVFTANAQTVVIDSVNTQLGFNASMDTIPVKINIIGCPDLNKKVWVEIDTTSLAGTHFYGIPFVATAMLSAGNSSLTLYMPCNVTGGVSILVRVNVFDTVTASLTFGTGNAMCIVVAPIGASVTPVAIVSQPVTVYTVTEGQNFMFSPFATFSGSPAPIITVYKIGGGAVTTPVNGMSINFGINNVALVDSGYYYATAIQGNTVTTSTMHLIVNPIVPPLPTFSVIINQLATQAGFNATGGDSIPVVVSVTNCPDALTQLWARADTTATGLNYNFLSSSVTLASGSSTATLYIVGTFQTGDIVLLDVSYFGPNVGSVTSASTATVVVPTISVGIVPVSVVMQPPASNTVMVGQNFNLAPFATFSGSPAPSIVVYKIGVGAVSFPTTGLNVNFGITGTSFADAGYYYAVAMQGMNVAYTDTMQLLVVAQPPTSNIVILNAKRENEISAKMQVKITCNQVVYFKAISNTDSVLALLGVGSTSDLFSTDSAIVSPKIFNLDVPVSSGKNFVILGYMYQSETIWHYTSVSIISAMTFLGIEEASLAEKFSAYPNPVAQGNFIRMNIPEVGIIEVIDILGKVIARETFKSKGEFTHQINGMTDGVYFLRFTGVSTGQKTVKIVVRS